MIAEQPRFQWTLYGLHLAIGVGLIFAFTVLMGCLKGKPTKEDLGPEYSSDNINTALARVVQKADFSALTVGQFLDFSSTRRLENQDTSITLGARRVEVIDRQDTATQATFSLRITNSSRQVSGNFLTTVAEDHLVLNKAAPAPPTGTSIPLTLVAPTQGPITAESLVKTMATATPQKKVTFHHLRESDQTIDPPDYAKQRADCGGISPCQLPVHYVQFDMVIWNDDTNYQKISLDFAFTLKTPFLPFGTAFDQLTGVLIVDCRSTYVPIDSRTVYVRDCLALDDFHK